MTNDGSNTLTHDAENRVTNSANGGSAGAYVFDGNSLRVQKTVSGATTVYIFSGTKVIAEYASGAAPSSPSKEYLYAGSQLLATLTGPPASATTAYHIADHLSPRVTTDSTGTVVGQQAHFPFGEDWYASSSTTKFKFTSYERDSESGNDYAMFRTSVNRLGRFSSPDPLAGFISDPQSLNRYGYALNDSINLADPSGLGTSIFTGMPVFCTETMGAYACWYPGEGGGWHYAPLLDDPPEPQRGGGHRNHVNKKVLNKCIQDLFGVTLKQLNESSQGQNGSFLGWGPDTVRNGGNDANISIVNDVNSFSSQELRAKGLKGGRPAPPPGAIVFGLEMPDNPYVNYTANNLSNYVVNQDLVPNVMAATQVHELGNSLSDITGAAFNPATVPGPDKDPGQALENCVRNKGGFIP